MPNCPFSLWLGTATALSALALPALLHRGHSHWWRSGAVELRPAAAERQVRSYSGQPLQELANVRYRRLRTFAHEI